MWRCPLRVCHTAVNAGHSVLHVRSFPACDPRRRDNKPMHAIKGRRVIGHPFAPASRERTEGRFCRMIDSKPLTFLSLAEAEVAAASLLQAVQVLALFVPSLRSPSKKLSTPPSGFESILTPCRRWSTPAPQGWTSDCSRPAQGPGGRIAPPL